MSFEDQFLKYSAEKLQQYATRIEDCLSRLSAEQIWMRGSASENAAGNLVLHLCGNVRQWICYGVGGQPDIRRRDAEFEAREGEQLSERLRATIAEAVKVIEAQTPETLARITRIQTYELTTMEAIYHVVEHFSGHTGQIIFLTKLMTGADLGYYKHLSKSSFTTASPEPTP